jgi:hypothetical protein
MSAPGPYGAAAVSYWEAGWRGVLPLPARKKKSPPKGFTGPGADPSRADLQTWIDDASDRAGNIALRLPVDIVGVDVDAYDGKSGAKTLAATEARLGSLPATWRTTSRDDGVSGIRFYRAPAGKSWTDIGEHVEIIHHGWRYALVWPSLHPEGRTYRWISPDGIVSTTLPNPDELPLLPPSWVAELCKGDATKHDRNTLPTSQAAQWLTSLTGATAKPCKRMTEVCINDTRDLTLGHGSAHDTACAAVARLVRLAAEGHPGITTSLEQVHAAFLGNVTSGRRAGTTRDAAEAQAEWLDLLVSAVNLVSASAPTMPSCDCDGQLTALIVGDRREQPPTPRVEGNTALADTAPIEFADASDRTTWWPRNLGPVVSGEQTEEPPTILRREDGQPLWYRGKVNGLIGESESGKTWIALEAVRQVITLGGRCLYLDFEDAAPGIVSRLRALGVDDDTITSRLTYMDPAETLNLDAKADLAETLQAVDYDLIVVDGFNAAMTLLGLDLMSNTDATKFSQMLLKPLSHTGAAVAYVDHVPKNGKDETSGGIGAQAKRAMTTGCALRVRVTEPFGKGMTGELVITIDKDRAGHVRGASGGGKSAGVATLASDSDTGSVTVSIAAPDMTSAQQRNRGRQEMRWEAICDFISSSTGAVSTTAIVGQVPGNKQAVIDDLAGLERGGFIRDTGTVTSHKWVVIKPFSVAESLTRTPVRTRTQPVRVRGVQEGESTRTPVHDSRSVRGTGRPTGSETTIVTTTVAGETVRVDLSTGEVLP